MKKRGNAFSGNGGTEGRGFNQGPWRACRDPEWLPCTWEAGSWPVGNGGPVSTEEGKYTCRFLVRGAATAGRPSSAPGPLSSSITGGTAGQGHHFSPKASEDEHSPAESHYSFPNMPPMICFILKYFKAGIITFRNTLSHSCNTSRLPAAFLVSQRCAASREEPFGLQDERHCWAGTQDVKP